MPTLSDRERELLMYAVARQVTDEEAGPGTYDRLNGPRRAGLADSGDALRQRVAPDIDVFLEELRQALRDTGLTQRVLAERIGIQASTLSDFQRGKLDMTMAKLRKMRDVLTDHALDGKA